MSAEDYFSRNYHDARDKFLAACRQLRLRPIGVRKPGSPEESGPPLVDCLRLGTPGATNLLIILGGDRLTDALCCSAIEIGWLRQFGKANLPSDSAILLLHHDAAPKSGGEVPDSGGPPPQWEDDILARVEERYAEYARQQGIDATGAPLAAPKDGDVAGYPTQVMDMLARTVAPTAPNRIVIVEIRVGTGPWGEAELIPCHPPSSENAKRIRKWFSLAEPSEDEPPGDRNLDHLGTSLRRRFPDADIAAARASFGTYSMMSVLESLSTRPEGQAMPSTGQLVFPENSEWREAVWQSAIVVIQRALTGLHSR